MASEKVRQTSARSRRITALAVKSPAAARWRPDPAPPPVETAQPAVRGAARGVTVALQNGELKKRKYKS